ncbi:hypothetical protein Tcan_04653 [Toxocara canis]|uniref:Uncharacterized protein n=1 Tax=Toxocara canis TaxID=6265 RepID=A0A0B2VS65_TOXCA|nr:hypothetical protein Tcan_04653 [Toxocara canis]
MEQSAGKSIDFHNNNVLQTTVNETSRVELPIPVSAAPVVDLSAPVVNITKNPTCMQTELKNDVDSPLSVAAATHWTPGKKRKIPTEPQSPKTGEKGAAGLERLASTQKATACLMNVRSAAATAGCSIRQSSLSNTSARESVRKWQSKARNTRQYFFNKWKDLMKACCVVRSVRSVYASRGLVRVFNENCGPLAQASPVSLSTPRSGKFSKNLIETPFGSRAIEKKHEFVVYICVMHREEEIDEVTARPAVYCLLPRAPLQSHKRLEVHETRPTNTRSELFLHIDEEKELEPELKKRRRHDLKLVHADNSLEENALC